MYVQYIAYVSYVLGKRALTTSRKWRENAKEGPRTEGWLKDNPLTKLQGQHRLDWTKGSEEGVGRTRKNYRSRALGGDKRRVNL